MSNLDQQTSLDQLVDRRIDNRRMSENNFSQGITLTIGDLVKILGLVGALVGTWVTLNKQITDITVKQSVTELQFTELKQTISKLDTKVTSEEVAREKEKVELQTQLRDLESSLSQIYQKVTNKK